MANSLQNGWNLTSLEDVSIYAEDGQPTKVRWLESDEVEADRDEIASVLAAFCVRALWSDSYAGEAESECVAPLAQGLTWELREDGFQYAEFVADDAKTALAEVVSNVDRSNYPDAEGTLWIDVSVRCVETDEKDSETVTLDEDEPECSESEHNWQQSHALFGGLEGNPGCWGHGGGVIISEVCAHCGCKRVTDTWAQRPDTGEQGLRSVSYEEEAFTRDDLVEAGLAEEETEEEGAA